MARKPAAPPHVAEEEVSDRTVVMQIPKEPASSSEEADWTSLVDELDK